MTSIYPGFPLDLFEERKDLMRTECRHGTMGILLQLRAVEAPQLHWAHVCGEEGLPQLQGWGGMLKITHRNLVHRVNAVRN